MWVIVVPSYEQQCNSAVFGPFETNDAARAWLNAHIEELKPRIAPGGWTAWDHAEIWCPFNPDGMFDELKKDDLEIAQCSERIS
jgi:hypothetical protein